MNNPFEQQNYHNPFEVSTKRSLASRFNNSRIPKPVLIFLIIVSIVTILILLGFILLIAGVLISIYNENTKAQTIESEYDHQAYFAAQDYPNNVQILTTESNENAEAGAYQYTVGEDIEPGLYTFQLHGLSDEGIAPWIHIKHEGQSDEESYYISKDFVTDHERVYNINLIEGDTITINIQNDLPGVVYLIPQNDYQQFKLSPLTYGKFTAPSAIEPGEYIIPAGISGYVCPTEDYGFEGDCQSFGSDGEESPITVDSGQTLYVDNNWMYEE